jgi:hypothetical protein
LVKLVSFLHFTSSDQALENIKVIAEGTWALFGKKKKSITIEFVETLFFVLTFVCITFT